MINLNNFTLVLLIAHFLGDFHLQSEELAEAKMNSIGGLLAHLSIHSILLLGVLLLCRGQNFFSILAILISHSLIDWTKQYLTKYNLKPGLLFIFDQLIHISIILYIGQIYNLHKPNLPVNLIQTEILKWMLLILLITKPANVSFKILFSPFQNYQGATIKDATVPGAGAAIGNLERILSAIFLSMNSMGSIGLIYTAKSIARFKEIEQNQGFAEYYLIGTLYSILYVIVAYLLLF